MSNVKNASETKRCAIHVAMGTYDNATIFMKEYVDIYGGYDPKTWDRDVYEYASTLSGKNVRRVVVGANHSRIDGFTIKHGLINWIGTHHFLTQINLEFSIIIFLELFKFQISI